MVGFGEEGVDQSCDAADTGTLCMYTDLTASPKKIEIVMCQRLLSELRKRYCILNVQEVIQSYLQLA